MATMISRRPGSLRRPRHTSPNSPARVQVRQPEKQQKEREKQGGEIGMMEEWRRVGEKRGEGTVNWLEPRSQGRVAGGVGQGELQKKPQL